MAIESTLRDLARYVHVRLPHDLGWELEEIAARGVRIVFVFARGDAGLDLLKIEAGSVVRRMGERCRVHIIDGGDHIFSHNAPRAAMKEILSEELSMRAYPSTGTMRRIFFTHFEIAAESHATRAEKPLERRHCVCSAAHMVTLRRSMMSQDAVGPEPYGHVARRLDAHRKCCQA